MRNLHVAALALTAVLLGGCSNSESNGPNDPRPTDPTSGNNAPPVAVPTAFRPQFQPAQGILPYPTDLYMNGSTDGTVNAPALSVAPNGAAVNALDGFGLNGEITARFSAPVDAATLALPGAVVVLETTMRTVVAGTTVARVPVGVRRPLVAGTDYSVGLSAAVDGAGQIVTITPLRPLTPSTGGATPNGALVDQSGVGYVVYLTSAIRSAAGANAVADTDYATLRGVIGTPPNPANCAAITDPTSNGLCNQIAPQLQIAAAAGLTPANVVLSFSFTTQSVRDTLVRMATDIQNAATPAALGLQPLPRPGGGILTVKNILDPAGTNPALFGIADVYAGAITLPYYQQTPAQATTANPAPPLTGQWLSATPTALLPGVTCTATPTPAQCTRFVTRYNPVPGKVADVTLPVLATFPNATSGRTKPATGWPVVIFIHGLGGNRSNALAIAESYASQGFAVVAIDQPLHGIVPTEPSAALRLPGVAERTFDADYINNTTRQPPADGVVDPSGGNFIQVSSPNTSRDNLRQSAVDHLALAKALPVAAAVGQAAPLYDGTRIHLSGLSLGGITGANVASVPSAINTFALSVPGGGIAQLLLDSPTFGPSISGGVASLLGLNTLLYRVFFRDAQAGADAGDPLNHFAAAVANKPILLHKVVGDTVVPNSATDRLIAVGGLLKATAAGNWPSDAYVTFTAGTHGSLLVPNPAAVTVEMQREFVSFVVANGAGFPVTDASNVQP